MTMTKRGRENIRNSVLLSGNRGCLDIYKVIGTKCGRIGYLTPINPEKD